MAPPQVKLNEKPEPQVVVDSQGEFTEPEKQPLAFTIAALQSRFNDLADDPLDEKKKEAFPDEVTVETSRCNGSAHCPGAERRRRRRRHVACCVTLSILLLALLAAGTVCLVYRFKFRKGWDTYCGTKDTLIPEHVKVDHSKQLITVQPQDDGSDVFRIIHDYNRRLIAFLNATEQTCYIDRLQETFAEGYARWQEYEDKEHEAHRRLRVVEPKMEVDVLQYFGGEYIEGHCIKDGKAQFFYWVVEVEETEVVEGKRYIKV